MVRHRIFSNMYRDSVALMRLSAELTERPGIVQVSAVMATPANLDLLAQAGLLDDRIDASPDQLLIVVEGEDATTIDTIMAAAEAALAAAPGASADDEGARESRPRSLAMAAGTAADPTLALISTPGEYAGSEALKALRLGLNVMIFSDNVSLDDEIVIKKTAAESALLAMGPDCGTAIIDGVPLGFANDVRRGDIGIVGASGTGMQQVCCLIDRDGKGISQAIGTGGRDLHTAVGGITMSRGLAMLADDPDTKVIVLVSKPPDPDVANRLLADATAAGKPVVINFLGASADIGRTGNGKLHSAETLEDAAKIAIALSDGGRVAPREAPIDGEPLRDALSAARRLAPGQRFVRGLFSGGTLCYEAVMLLHEALAGVWSNTPRDEKFRLPDPWASNGHTIVDLGADEFTRGRPHPMIDHRLRNDRLIQEARDPETAVIQFDVVLGHGAHPDPAAAMIPALESARRAAEADGRDVVLIGSVCGTERDPQCLSDQANRFRAAGVVLAESNASAARLARAALEREE